MHPGWADTPGLRSGLPGFSRALAPLLRTARQGPTRSRGSLRRPRSRAAAASSSSTAVRVRRIAAASTRRLDEAQERARLWALCQNATASFNGRDSVI